MGMASATATIPLGELLRQYHLKLVQITGLEDRQLLEAPVQWVHSTDLLNPQPFITPRTVLLTTGSQFSQSSPEDETQRQYVADLVEAGVCALGFAVGFNYQRIPEAVIEACQENALPLFRVPYSTPFIDIIQTAARLIDREAHAREAWSVSAQRAIANRALRAGGVGPIVSELGAQLQTWTAIFNAQGLQVHASAPQPFSDEDGVLLHRALEDVLRNQVRASRTVVIGDQRYALQTLGKRGRLLGVLVVHDIGTLDRSAQFVTSFAVAMLSTALEQLNALTGPLDQLRSARLQLILEGHLDLAERFSLDELAPLPPAPIVVVALDVDDAGASRAGAILAALRDERSGSELEPDTLDVATLNGEIIAFCSSSQSARIAAVLRETDTRVGFSLSHSYQDFAVALEEARLARDTATLTPSGTVTTYSREMQRGVIDLLRNDPSAPERARALLEPILSSDERNGEQLAHSAKVWLEHHGQYVPAAAELGIHRHTLKTRMGRVRDLLGKDLDAFETRAELWSALTLLDHD